jgi:hypothetical protein
MSNYKTDFLKELFYFFRDNNYQLIEEYMREPKEYRNAVPFAAYCVNFYANLNDLTNEHREHYDGGDDRECLPMDRD